MYTYVRTYRQISRRTNRQTCRQADRPVWISLPYTDLHITLTKTTSAGLNEIVLKWPWIERYICVQCILIPLINVLLATAIFVKKCRYNQYLIRDIEYVMTISCTSELRAAAQNVNVWMYRIYISFCSRETWK